MSPQEMLTELLYHHEIISVAQIRTEEDLAALGQEVYALAHWEENTPRSSEYESARRFARAICSMANLKLDLATTASWLQRRVITGPTNHQE